MQLGLALESEKATLPVKRRLACEEVSYFAQVRSKPGMLYILILYANYQFASL